VVMEVVMEVDAVGQGDSGVGTEEALVVASEDTEAREVWEVWARVKQEGADVVVPEVEAAMMETEMEGARWAAEDSVWVGCQGLAAADWGLDLAAIQKKGSMPDHYDPFVELHHRDTV